MNMQKCSRCGEEKPHTKDYFYGQGRPHHKRLKKVCKKCCSARESKNGRKKYNPSKTKSNVNDRCWFPTKNDEREQAVLAEVIDCDFFDKPLSALTDADDRQWCKFMDQKTGC